MNARYATAALLLIVALAAAAPAVAQSASAAAQPQTAADPSSAPRSFRPSDLWTPLSSMHLGSFSVYSAGLEIGYSSQPMGLGNGFSGTRFGSIRDVGFLRGDTTLGLSHRTARGNFWVRYTPTFYRQTASGFDQLTHNAVIGYDRRLGQFWDLAVSLRGGTYNSYTTFFERPALEPVTRLLVPIANQDLLSVIDQPPAIAEPAAGNLLVNGRDSLRANAGVSLSRRLGPRERITFSGSYFMNQGLDEDGALAVSSGRFRTDGTQLSVGYSRTVSPRHTWGVLASEVQTRFAGHQTQEQRQVQFTYNWLPAPGWMVHGAAGPALRNQHDRLDGRHRLDAAVRGGIARSTRNAVIGFSFARELYIDGALPGGRQSQHVTVDWMPRSVGRRWSYGVSGGYMWLSGEFDGARRVHGWTFRPSLTVPINRSFYFVAQYVFFDQRTGAGTTTSLPMQWRRHMASIGLRWNFQQASER